jgi:hypothetical protein
VDRRLKPVPLEQLSQVELQRREETNRWFRAELDKERVRTCAASIGKTVVTLDRNDPAQEAPYRKCMWPEESQGRLRRAWDRIWGAVVW